jgi:transcriptional regulator of arginine metabolism
VGKANANAMKEKNRRHKAIRDIILKQEINHQEVLLDFLKKKGFYVTQATLSRDLNQLGVIKIRNAKGRYIYTLPGWENTVALESQLKDDFLRGFLCLEFSAFLGIIKTLPGHANSVAFALDKLDIELILGTVAGDDTILVVPRDGATREQIKAALLAKIPELVL